MTKPITFTLDGREVIALPGETIWLAAKRLGTEIPHLCWLPEPGYRADGNCRACMVEIEGERVLAAPASEARARHGGQDGDRTGGQGARMVMELLLADQPRREDLPDRVSPVLALGRTAGNRELALSGARRSAAGPFASGDGGQSFDACIDCGFASRLPRSSGQRRDRHGVSRHRREACLRLSTIRWEVHLRRLRGVRAGLSDRRAHAEVHRRYRLTQRGSREVDREVDSVCPYCGVGCQITYKIRDEGSRLCKATTGRPTRTGCA